MNKLGSLNPLTCILKFLINNLLDCALPTGKNERVYEKWKITSLPKKSDMLRYKHRTKRKTQFGLIYMYNRARNMIKTSISAMLILLKRLKFHKYDNRYIHFFIDMHII